MHLYCIITVQSGTAKVVSLPTRADTPIPWPLYNAGFALRRSIAFLPTQLEHALWESYGKLKPL